MKYIKLFENFEEFEDEDWDFEEEYEEDKSIKDIPIYQKVRNTYDQKDQMRIINIMARNANLSFEHALRQARTMANRITHIDKAIKRGNACLFGGAYGLTDEQKIEMANIFHNRAKKLYFG